MMPSSLTKNIFLGCWLIVTLCWLLLTGSPSWGTILLVNAYIVLVYLFNMPKKVFHPNNIVFTFNFLYVCVPSSLFLIYKWFGISYSLPWAPPNWLAFHQLTYIHILFIYTILFYSTFYFTKNIEQEELVSYQLNSKVLLLLILLLCIIAYYYICRSGGLPAWISNYEHTYLVNRKGLGVYGFIIEYMSAALAFYLGLVTFKLKGYKKGAAFILSLLLIIVLTYIQGFKSRFPMLLIIYFMPYFREVSLNIKKIIIFGGLFVGFLIVADYLRSNEFYNSLSKSVEYFMTYFNVYALHDMILNTSHRAIFSTIYYPIYKYLSFFFHIDSSSSFDLSVTLTKKYFPSQWYVDFSTQQWPLMTDLYFNFYGMLLGWLPLIIYSYIVSRLYKLFSQGLYPWMIIYLLEFFRLFSTMRSTLIPWEIFVILFFYIVIYLLTKVILYVPKNNI